MIDLYNDAHATSHQTLKQADPYELGHDVGYFVNNMLQKMELGDLTNIEELDSTILKSVVKLHQGIRAFRISRKQFGVT